MAPKRHISATLHKRCGDRHPVIGKLAVCHVVQLVVAAGHPVVGDERPRPVRLWSSWGRGKGLSHLQEIHVERLHGIARRECRRHGLSVLCAVTRARVYYSVQERVAARHFYPSSSSQRRMFVRSAVQLHDTANMPIAGSFVRGCEEIVFRSHFHL